MSDRIVDISVLEFRLPLRVPLVTSCGSVETRDAAIVRVETTHGVVGLGEASVPQWLPAGASAYRRAVDALRERSRRLVQRRLDAEALLLEAQADGLPAAASSALQTAALDVAARSAGCAVARLLGASSDASLQVSALIEGGTAAVAIRAAGDARSRGFSCVKLKVGVGDLDAEAELVRAVRVEVGDRVAIRLDANGAWSAAEAERAVAAFEPCAIEFIEEPIGRPTPSALAKLRACSSVPIAVDESVDRCEDLARLLDADAVDAVVIKLLRVGGPASALELARMASRGGRSVVFTDSIETSIGMRAAVHTASAAGCLRSVGLGGAFWLDDDVVDVGGVTSAPEVEATGPGLGVELAP